MLTYVFRDRRLTSIVGWTGLLLVSLALGAAVPMLTSASTFPVWEMAMLGCFAFGLWMWRSLGFAHPLAWMSTLFSVYFLVGVQNWVQPSEHLGFRSYVNGEATLRIAVPALFFFIAGVVMTSGVVTTRIQHPATAKDAETQPNVIRAGKFLFAVGILGLVATIQHVGVPILHPAVRAEGNHGVWAICTYALVPAALLLTMNTNTNSRYRDIGIISACSVLLLLLAYRSPIVLLVGTFLISRLIQGRIRQRMLILGGVALVVFSVIVFSYRAQATGRSVSGKYVVPAGPFRTVPALFPLYIGFAREGTAIFARLHEVMGGSTPFMHGSLQASIFHLHSGELSPRQYVYDIALGTNTAVTTYTPTILGGPYIDFGFFGVVSELFVMGLVSGWLYHLVRRDRRRWRTMIYSYWMMLVVLSIHAGLLDDSTLVIVPIMVVAAIAVANVISAHHRDRRDTGYPLSTT